MSIHGGLSRRSVGAAGLWLYAVAASAPMTVLAAGVVTTFAVTGVAGVPLSFLLLTAGLWPLTVGYAAMSRHLAHAAPFFAVLAHGLGRAWGVAGGLLAVVAYCSVQICLYGFVGAALAAQLGGAWWVWAAVVWAVIAVLGVLRVDIGAGVLGALLVAEIAVIVLVDVAAFTHPAGGSVSLAGLSPERLFVGDVGAVFALGIAAFVGYESGQAYAEEARSDRAVGRAALAALAVIGPLYAVSAWALTVAAGADGIQQATAADPNLPFTVLENLGLAGVLVASLGRVLLLTSVAGAMLSFHATVARYVFGLAREGLLPAGLARTGVGSRVRRDAPVGGSVLQSMVAAVVVAGFALAGADPVTVMFTWLSVLAAFGVLTLLVGSCLAALCWFRRGGGAAEGVWTRILAPIGGIVAGTAVLAVMTARMPALLGPGSGSSVTTLAVPVMVAVVVVVGLCWAGLVRLSRPDVYHRIGHGRPHPLFLPDQRLRDVRL